MRRNATAPALDLGRASQWQLVSLRFSRHKLAVLSAYILVLLYMTAIFAELVAPQDPGRINPDFAYCPPQPPRISLAHGLHVYAMKRSIDPVTLQDHYTEDRTRAIKLGFFVRGDPYKLWGLIPMRRHLLGVAGKQVESKQDGEPTKVHDPGTLNTEHRTLNAFFLFGADRFGRDLFSRIVYGARISLSVGLIGISLSFCLGCLVGGISGYAGGSACWAGAVWLAWSGAASFPFARKITPWRRVCWARAMAGFWSDTCCRA